MSRTECNEAEWIGYSTDDYSEALWQPFPVPPLERHLIGKEPRLVCITWFKYTKIHRRHCSTSNSTWPHPTLKDNKSCLSPRSKYFRFAKACCWEAGQNNGYRARARYPALPLPSWVPTRTTLGLSLPHLENEENSNIYLMGLLGLNKLIDIKDF